MMSHPGDSLFFVKVFGMSSQDVWVPREMRHSETGNQYLNCMTREYFTTGIPCLDGLSQRNCGVATGTIVELFGGPRVGKTKMAIDVTCTFVLPRPLGGHKRHVIYLDMDGKFDANRLRDNLLQRVVEKRGNDTHSKRIQNSNLVDACLGRVLVIRCEDARQVNGALQHTRTLLSTTNVGLVVLSNLAGCFFDNRSRNAQNTFGTMVAKHIASLRSEHRVVVLVTTATIFEKAGSGANRHLLGRNWEKLSKYHFTLPLSTHPRTTSSNG